ncbi:MAG: hypothetical protein JO372_06980 [Solirubrobacterales bacterium]|nr:hypothetical protein [Solirubrobacterales bacterium]
MLSRERRSTFSQSDRRSVQEYCAPLERELIRRALSLTAAVVGLVSWLVPGICEARGLRPDRAFGGRGWVILRIAGQNLSANAVTVLPGGGVVVAGQLTPVRPPPTGGGQVFVAEYRADGRLNYRFARRGVFVTRLPNRDGPFDATAVARDRSGGLLVAGGYGQGAMLLMRLTANGRLDRSFGPKRAGFVTRQIGSIASSMIVRADGTILLGGSNANVMGRPMVVAGFTRRGFVDRRFGRAGVVQVLFWNARSASSSNVSSLTATADRGVIASGHVDYIGGRPGQSGYGKAGIFRLSATGRLVRSFGGQGHVLIGFRNAQGSFKSWFPCAMTAGPRGAITVTGDGSSLANGQVLTARLTRTGRLDPSFGRGGRAVVPGPGSGSITTCGAVAASARRFTVGVGATLVQLSGNGRPNPRFAPNGRFRITSPRGVGLQAVARAGGGRLVVAGYAGQAAYAARYALGAAR